jgi:hypothetical protein
MRKKYLFRRMKNMDILFLTLSKIYLHRETVLRRFWQEPSRGKSLFLERSASQSVDEREKFIFGKKRKSVG